MATKLEKEYLGNLIRKVMSRHTGEMMEIANKNIGKSINELVEQLQVVDQEMGVEFATEIIQELDRMGVNFTEVWEVLDRNGLVEWAK